LRQQAARILEETDASGTQEQREFLQHQIGGVLDGERVEFLNKYQGSITNYARNFTAKTKTYVGFPEAIALAHHLQRPIAIITPTTEAEIQRLAALNSHYHPADMVLVALPNFELRVRQYFIQYFLFNINYS
jgi:hypothetical protein